MFGKFKENYIDTGKVKFVYREVYFDRFGLWAGMLARCGGGMRYFGIADILYNTQPNGWRAATRRRSPTTSARSGAPRE